MPYMCTSTKNIAILFRIIPWLNTSIQSKSPPLITLEQANHHKGKYFPFLNIQLCINGCDSYHCPIAENFYVLSLFLMSSIQSQVQSTSLMLSYWRNYSLLGCVCPSRPCPTCIGEVWHCKAISWYMNWTIILSFLAIVCLDCDQHVIERGFRQAGSPAP